MNYLLTYPKLSSQLKELVIDNNYCDQQFLLLLNIGLDNEPVLIDEIVSSFNDESFSWMEILNNKDIGEVFACDSEREAREFAIEMFLKPATRARNN